MTPTHTKFVEKLLEIATPHFVAARDAQLRGEQSEHRPNFGAVFYGHGEIQAALDSLELTRTLILRAPPRSTAVKRPEYLRYLIGNYLQEVYILRERLVTYAKKLKRIYKPEGALCRRLDDMPKLVENSFAAMTDHRGTHVHEERYGDKELNYMSMLYTVANGADHLPAVERATYAREAAKHYRALSLKWGGLVAETIKNLEALLETYFGVLLGVTTVGGSFQIPESPANLQKQPRYVRGAAKPKG